MRRQCEGYCGGMVRLEATKTTPDGERFCPGCYAKLELMKIPGVSRVRDAIKGEFYVVPYPEHDPSDVASKIERKIVGSSAKANDIGDVVVTQL